VSNAMRNSQGEAFRGHDQQRLTERTTAYESSIAGRFSGKRDLPGDFKWTLLKAVHDSGYVFKDGLSQLFRVEAVTIGRVIDELVRERFVRLAGYAVGCPHLAFRWKYFYTPTKADVTKRRPEITRFYMRSEYLSMSGPMPTHCFLARRNKAVGETGEVKRREEWVPIHSAGSHLAAAFFASVVNQSPDVTEIAFTPERVLRRVDVPLFPMPDGLISLNGGTDYEYSLEFESYEKPRWRYQELFDLHERGARPTVYIALTRQIASDLDLVAKNRKRIAVVMYGDQEGCRSACEGLNADLFWQPPRRGLDGPTAGYDLDAQDESVGPPGDR
jgi:hypothetical protein